MKKSDIEIIYGEYDDGSILLTTLKNGIPYWPITCFVGGLGLKPNKNHVFLTRVPEEDIDLSPIIKNSNIVSLKGIEGQLIELVPNWKEILTNKGKI